MILDRLLVWPKTCATKDGENMRVFLFNHLQTDIEFVIKALLSGAITLAISMKTGLNNVLLPTLLNVINSIVRYCYT